MISWLGLSASYTEDERSLMAQLPVKEQTTLHVLKSLTDGKIQEGLRVNTSTDSGSGEVTPARGHGLNDGSVSAAAPAVYTNLKDTTLHVLKSLTDGSVTGPGETTTQIGSLPETEVDTRQPRGKGQLHRASNPDTPLEAQESNAKGTKWLDPSEIPFGDSRPLETVSAPVPRVKKTYAIVWSWRKHRITKTKKRAQEKVKVWRAWKRRQGWNVYRVGEAYFADKGPLREAALVHEYDRETLERLV